MSNHPKELESTFLHEKWNHLSRTGDGGNETLVNSVDLKIHIRVDPQSGRHVVDIEFPAYGPNPRIPCALKFIEIREDRLPASSRKHLSIRFDARNAGEGGELWPHFAESLTQNVHATPSKSDVMKSVAATFKTWAKLWPGKRGLSERSLQGLFAELLFLRKLAASKNWGLAVEAWHGPGAIDHDFAAAGHAFEVKSTTGKSSKVEISNFSQLMVSGRSSLHLVHLQLRKSELLPQDSFGKLGEDLLSLLKDQPEVRNVLLKKMIAAGWMKATPEQKEHQAFRLTRMKAYQVQPDFPRLLAEDIERISPALSIEKFKVDLAQCAKFETPKERFDLLLSSLQETSSDTPPLRPEAHPTVDFGFDAMDIDEDDL